MTEKILIDLNKDPNIDFNKNRDRHGSRGGGTKGPLWIVQLILQQLVNVTPPTSIFQNIVSHVSPTIPSVESRTVLSIIGENLTAYYIPKSNNWEKCSLMVQVIFKWHYPHWLLAY